MKLRKLDRPATRMLSFVLVSALVVGALSLGAIDARGDTLQIQSASAGDLFSILGSQRTSQDEAPRTQRQLVPDSARRLYSGEGEVFWLALDLNGNICLAGLTDSSKGPVVAMTCDAPDRISVRGLSLRLTVDRGGFDVTALPDSWSTAELKASIEVAGGELLGSNLLRFDPSGRPASIQVELQGQDVDLGSRGR
jgi:hypothetical protein